MFGYAISRVHYELINCINEWMFWFYGAFDHFSIAIKGGET
jgi:hypothetical protein